MLFDYREMLHSIIDALKSLPGMVASIDSWKILFGKFSLIDLFLVFVVVDCTITLIRLKSGDK